MASYTEQDKENFPHDAPKPERLSITLSPALTELRPHHPPASTKPRGFAFAFDVDGVLVRGNAAIPGARAALQKLQEHAVPFILLTNGGGLTEAAHAARVGQRLGMKIAEEQFVQSHTPFKAHADKYKGKRVLVLGGARDLVKQLAAAYGFDRDKILSTSDLARHHAGLHPFPEMTSAHHEEWGHVDDAYAAADAAADGEHEHQDHHQDNNTTNNNNNNNNNKKISAIFVFSSPRDWCLDLQVCLDLLLSRGGVLGTRSPLNGDERLPNCGYLQDDPPKLYFCNPDFEWATPFAVARLAQGGFRAALEGVWAAATKGKGGPLPCWTCGKPTSTTYEYGEAVLERFRRGAAYPGGHAGPNLDTKGATATATVTMVKEEGEQEEQEGEEAPTPPANNNIITTTTTTATRSDSPLETVYMVGDNPESDIRGALRADRVSHLRWRSVLVETGVHRRGSKPAYAPTYVAEDVWGAVRRVLLEEKGEDIGPLVVSLPSSPSPSSP